MNPRLRAATSAASLLLVAASAVACGGGGGGSDAPKGASKSDFCNAYQTFQTNLTKIDPSDPQAAVKTFKSEAKKFSDVGTPDNVTSAERSGYEAVLDAIDSLPDDASLADLEKVGDSLSATDKKNSQAFDDYLSKECPDAGVSGSGSSSN